MEKAGGTLKLKHNNLILIAVSCVLMVCAFNISPCAAETGTDNQDIKSDRVERLVATGLSPHFSFIAACLHAKGKGLNGNDNDDCTYDTNLSLNLDFEKAGIGKGDSIYLDMEVRQGPGITARRLGDLFGVNRYEGRSFTQISELWYRKEYPSGTYFKIGQMDGGAEFQVLDNSGDFQNSAFTMIANTTIPTFPNYAYGAVLNAAVSRHSYIRFGAIDGAATDNTSRMETAFDKVFYGFEYGYSPTELKSEVAKSTYRVGVFDRTGAYNAAFDGLDHKGNHGLFFAADQILTDKIASFFQYGGASGDRNLITRYFGGGLVFRNSIKSRPDDNIGLAFNDGLVNSYVRSAGSGRGESVIEFYYSSPIRHNITIMPDFQWLRRTGENSRNNIVYGFKLQYAF
jgi:carbohydrate-selective porin OprB